MTQLYRALHKPPNRLFKKLTGQKEIYTIAVRRIPADEPLPALGEGAFTPLPFDGRTWYADPLLYVRDGARYIFCEVFDLAAGRGDIAVIPLSDDGRFGTPQVVLSTGSHLSFPTVFDWNGETWMLPESSAEHTLTLYRCAEFPGKWEQAARFAVGCEICDTILLSAADDALTLLARKPAVHPLPPVHPAPRPPRRRGRGGHRRRGGVRRLCAGAGRALQPAASGVRAGLPQRRAAVHAGRAGHPAHPGQHQGGLRRLPAVFLPAAAPARCRFAPPSPISCRSTALRRRTWWASTPIAGTTVLRSSTPAT